METLVGEECSNYLSAPTCLPTENLVYGICMPTGAAAQAAPKRYVRATPTRKSHSPPYVGLSNRSPPIFRPLFGDCVLRRVSLVVTG